MEELLSNLVYGGAESSGFPADFSFINAIDEPDIEDDVGELTEAAQASPAFLSAHGELMHEAQGAFGAHTISGLHRAQSNGGESGLDEIGSTEMLPVSGREVVEGKQHLTVPDQPIDRLGILCFVGGHEAIQRLYNGENEIAK